MSPVHPSLHPFFLSHPHANHRSSHHTAVLLTQPNTPTANITADRILATNFTLYSDSINSLLAQPLGAPTYPAGRAGFLLATSTNTTGTALAPIPTLLTTDVYVGGYWNASYVPPTSNDTTTAAASEVQAGGNSWWSGNGGGLCTDLRITWRWSAQGVGSGANAVMGITDLVLSAGDAASGEDVLVVETAYTEFNSAAWAANVGAAVDVAASA